MSSLDRRWQVQEIEFEWGWSMSDQTGKFFFNKLYLSVSFLNSITRHQLMALHQASRLVSKLTYALGVFRATSKDDNPMYWVVNMVEGLGFLVSTLDEAIHRFYFPNSKQEFATFDELRKLTISPVNLAVLEQYRKRREERATDPTFSAYQRIRNNFGFHYHEDYFADFVTEGTAIEPQRFALQIPDGSREMIYPFTYDLFVGHLNGIPTTAKEGRELMDKLIKTSQDEAIEFKNAIERALLDIVSGTALVVAEQDLWDDSIPVTGS